MKAIDSLIDDGAAPQWLFLGQCESVRTLVDIINHVKDAQCRFDCNSNVTVILSFTVPSLSSNFDSVIGCMAGAPG